MEPRQANQSKNLGENLNLMKVYIDSAILDAEYSNLMEG